MEKDINGESEKCGWFISAPDGDKFIAINCSVDPSKNFKANAEVTPAQNLGLGPKAYEQLMKAEAEYQELKKNPNAQVPRMSPVENLSMELFKMQVKLGMTNEQFIALKKAESDHQANIESGQPSARQSPFMEAFMKKEAQAANQGFNKDGFDFTQK